MKKRLLTMLAMLMVIALMPFGAYATEDTVPAADTNMTTTADAATAETLPTDGSEAKGTIKKDETKQYVFKLSEGGTFTLDVKSPDTNLNIALKGPIKKKELQPIKTESMNKGEASFVYYLDPGDYQIDFSGATVDEEKEFILKASFTAETYPGDKSKIDLVRSMASLTFGQAVTGVLTVNGNINADGVEIYKITVPSSGTFSVDVNNTVDSVQVRLYADDTDKTLVADGGKMGKGVRNFSYDLRAGTYYLKFENKSTQDATTKLFAESGTYSFTPNFTASGKTYEYDNTTINIARNNAAIPLATDIRGHLAIKNYEEGCYADIYKVVISKKERHVVRVDSKVPSLYFSIANDSGTEIADVYGDRKRTHSAGIAEYTYDLGAGTYYLKFESTGKKGPTGIFDFRVTNVKSLVTLSTTSIKKIKKGKKKLVVYWKKANCTGYQVQCALDSGFMKGKKTVTVNKKSKTAKTISKLKSRKAYYVRVRTYKTVYGKKYYSKWSKKVKYRTK